MSVVSAVAAQDADHPQGSYGAEISANKRVLAAVTAGMGAGFLLNHYIANTFAPNLIDEFGWSRSGFALVGALGLISLLVIPFVGRMTDRVGSRRVAMIGVITFPLTFIAYSQMSGSLTAYAVITLIQNLICGATTSSVVYSRLIAERFVTARGLALAVAATSPALVGLLGTPALQNVIDAQGWRAGYLAVAAWTAVIGGLALILIPRRTPDDPVKAKRKRRTAREDYPLVLRSPTFWAIFAGFFLCNLIYPMQSTQMKLMLLENGATPSFAALLISVFAGGVMVGRIACGLALDRFPAHWVAAIAMGLPAIGLFMLAAGVSTPPVLGLAVVLMGLSLGAESDLAAYLVMRYFPVAIYGTVLGLVVTSLALSATIGALVLSYTLNLVDHFWLYMLIAGITSVIGALLFLFLGRQSSVDAEQAVPVSDTRKGD
jgi:MFS family permease